MATFTYSTFVTGSVIAFNPLLDVLQIDLPNVSAASFALAQSGASSVVLTGPDRSLILSGAVPLEIGSANVQFANGSRIVRSEAVTQFAGDLVGTAGDDLLIGSHADRPIVRVSIATNGTQGDFFASRASVSGTGRFVSFESSANNLVAGDTNLVSDVFVRDTVLGTLTRVSTSSLGVQGNAASSDAWVSADGSQVAFSSDATNLVAGDTNATPDIFVKSLRDGSTVRISTDATGAQANGPSFGAVISNDGSVVGFHSIAGNLVAGDTNAQYDVFVKNLQTGAIALASTDAIGTQGNAISFNSALSHDGRWVTFQSLATNLAASDTNAAYDIFVKDMQTGTLARASVDAAGAQGNGESINPTISADGRWVAFESAASNLVAGDTNASNDIFVKDMLTGTVLRASTSAAGFQANAVSARPMLSADGRYLAFQSDASNLVAGDTNNARDTFIKDLRSGAIVRVSVDALGNQVTPDSFEMAISADGQMLAFEGNSASLVAGDTNGFSDIYLTSNPLHATVLAGGLGNDSYVLDNVRDTLVEALNGGTDTVRASVSHALGLNFENLVLMGSANLDGTGNTLNNVLTGNAGDNVLDGGLGSDTASYSRAATAVTVSLAVGVAQATGGGGTDTLISIENLIGSNLGDQLTGNAAANQLNGGRGADTMTGGNGSDVYTVDHAGDVVVETNAVAATGGTDLVIESLAAYTLGANVENGRILSTGLADLTGNGLNNTLQAGLGNNVLDGGAGTDTASYAGLAAVTVSLAVVGAQATVGSGNDTLLGIENLIGSNAGDSLTGNAGANALNGGLGADTMTGGDGSDSYTVDNAGDVVSETNALAAGGIDLVNSLLGAYALGANVENGRIIATGSSILTGNTLANVLYAGPGNSVLDGGAGIDTASYAFATGSVFVNLGVATAQNTGGSASDTLIRIENLTGSAFGDSLTGNGGANVLDGGLGVDILTGGAGSDTYVVDHPADFIVETGPLATETDTVRAGVSWTLGANLENLALSGSAAINGTGNALANVITGNAAGNVLSGAAGNDHLDGRGGADTLIGGLGNEVYTVDNAGDVVIEALGEGDDSVNESLVAYTLTDNVERGRILLTSAADLTGNGLNNTLYAGAGDNVIDGGAGGDVASYTFASAAVNVDLNVVGAQATGGSGSDTLIAIEHLSGSAFADTLIGNAGANQLDGGIGADTLIGGAGNDVYLVDNLGDVVEELLAGAAGGTDQVNSGLASYTLGANIERGRSLVGNLTGNTLANLLSGAGGANVFDGGAGNDTLSGGLGADVLTGGSGADVFRFDTAAVAASHATITDFSVVDDTIQLENFAFTALLTPGVLAAENFVSGAGRTTAVDANDFLIYDSSTGALYYDADGSGLAFDPVQFALVNGLPPLTNLDFTVS